MAKRHNREQPGLGPPPKGVQQLFQHPRAAGWPTGLLKEMNGIAEIGAATHLRTLGMRQILKMEIEDICLNPQHRFRTGFPVPNRKRQLSCWQIAK